MEGGGAKLQNTQQFCRAQRGEGKQRGEQPSLLQRQQREDVGPVTTNDDNHSLLHILMYGKLVDNEE